MENQAGQTPKKNSNVIYFLIVVVLALLGTDVYLYLQKNKPGKFDSLSEAAT
jgi:flagellar basal body-associated protein FliL